MDEVFHLSTFLHPIMDKSHAVSRGVLAEKVPREIKRTSAAKQAAEKCLPKQKAYLRG